METEPILNNMVQVDVVLRFVIVRLLLISNRETYVVLRMLATLPRWSGQEPGRLIGINPSDIRAVVPSVRGSMPNDKTRCQKSGFG
jgi:hypothetical protein